MGKHSKDDDEDPQKSDGLWGRIPPEGERGKHSADDEDEDDED